MPTAQTAKTSNRAIPAVSTNPAGCCWTFARKKTADPALPGIRADRIPRSGTGAFGRSSRGQTCLSRRRCGVLGSHAELFKGYGRDKERHRRTGRGTAAGCAYLGVSRQRREKGLLPLPQ